MRSLISWKFNNAPRRVASQCVGRTGIFFWLLACAAFAQSPDDGRSAKDADRPIDQILASVAAAIEQMDILALNCQVVLANDEPDKACGAFLAAMNGEPFERYSQGCAATRQWRDAQIEARLGDGEVADPAQAETLLEQMMQSESLCGEEALGRRSSAIIPVYSKLDRRQNTSLTSQLQDLQFRQLYEYRRLQDQQLGQALRQRQDQVTNELFQRQQQELLRQEVQRESLHSQDIWRN